MRKKILAFVFVAALLMGMAVPLSGGSVYASHDKGRNMSDDSIFVCLVIHNPTRNAKGIEVHGDAIADHLGHGDTSLTCNSD